MLALHGYQADEQAVEDLLEATEGWAAGLYLAALSGYDRGLGAASCAAAVMRWGAT